MNWKKKKGGKKCLMLAILLVLVFATSLVFADAGPSRFSNYQNVKTYVCTTPNASFTGLNATTSISTTTISPLNHRILGFSISEYDSALTASREAALYDCAAGGELATAGTLLDEGESADDVSFVRWYPFPMSITTQLTVRQGANTVVVIYYEDKREI